MDEMEELKGLMRARANTYGFLAHLYLEEVTMDQIQEMRAMRFPVATGSNLVDSGYRNLYDYMRTSWEGSVRELSIDYVRTFIGHGVNGYSAAYPFESVHTSERRLMMQEARAEVLAIFRENMLKRGTWTEGEDHIALELEFMQRMALRTIEDLEAGCEREAANKLATQRDFAHDHLLNWLPALTADMQKFAKTAFYRGLAQLTLGYVQEDARVLDEMLECSEATVA